MGPTTTLDARFSDPAAVAVSWDKTRMLLEASELFWVCTVRPDGRPHATSLVAAWVDEAVYFRSGTIEQKFANLSNPHVVLLTGCNQWDGGIDVVWRAMRHGLHTPPWSSGWRRRGYTNGTGGGTA